MPIAVGIGIDVVRLPTRHRRSRLPLTNSASIPGPDPERSRACWSVWPRCPALAIRAAYGTLWSPCSR
ncbi:hypothetical protein RKD44_000138 [Streptomyces collinus]